MDVNKDGIVPRKEFEKEFLSSMQQIVNMQALAQTAKKVMESISESDLEQLRSLVDPEMLKQLAQMVEACTEECLRFELEHGLLVVLKRASAHKATRDVLETHCIPEAKSADLR